MRLVVFTFAFLVVISSSVCRAIIKVPAHVATNHQTAQRLPAESQFKQLLSRLRTQDKSVASVSNKKDVACDLVIAAVDSPAEPLTLFELAICGAFASAFGDFIMHPVDTIKVVQQTSTAATTILATAANIFKQSGIVGFYPGVAPYCIADGISGAIKFAVFEASKSFSEARLEKKFHPVAQFVCAAGAMLACSVALVPGEVIKTRLQSGLYGSLKNVISTTFTSEGLGGFYAGYFATLVRDVPYTMLELGLYENIKVLIKYLKNGQSLNNRDEFTAAAITGGITSFITTPLDLIKTKLMVQTAGAGYGGIGDAMQSIFREGGLAALFVGSSARVAWLLPFTVIYLGVYEISKRRIVKLRKVAKA